MSNTPDYKLGNEFEGGGDADTQAYYYEAVLRSLEEKCRGCWARFLCGGQRPWYLSLEGKRIAIPDEESCTHIRGNTVESLMLYVALREVGEAVAKQVIEFDSLIERAGVA